MKALTLIQPWGGLIATGVKLVENRTWPPPESLIGQQFAIHAGARIERETIEDLLEDDEPEHALWRVRSAVIGVVTLVGWVREGATNSAYSPDRIDSYQLRWWNGPIGFLLRDAFALPRPVPCKGMLGFWTLPEPIAVEVMDQVVNRG